MPRRPWTYGVPLSRSLAKSLLGTRYSATDSMGIVDIPGNARRTSRDSRRYDLSPHASKTWKRKASGWRHTVEERRLGYSSHRLVDCGRDAATLWRNASHDRLQHTEWRISIDGSSHPYTRSNSTKWYTLWLSNYNSNASPLRMPG